MHETIPLVAIVGLLSGACTDREAESDDWVATRDTIGDTVVVTTLSGSGWGQPATLIEELAIGVLEGSDEFMFGQVQAMAPDAHGGVYVFDGQVPALRHYDGDGRYLGTLGREGSGPGEYRDMTLGIAVRTDGRVVMRDPRNGRLNVYDVGGMPWAHWPVASGLYTSGAMVVDTADHMFLKVLLELPEPNRNWRIGLLHFDAEGEFVDTIPEPEIAGEPSTPGGTFLPAKVWAWSPLGYMVVGLTGEYRFEIRTVRGAVVHVIRRVEPISVLPDERAAYEARNDWRRRTQGQSWPSEILPVPSTKPAYRALYVGQRGRIWLHRHVSAVRVPPETEPRPDGPPAVDWREPTVFDVFEADGTYLGEVRVPERTNVHVFAGDTLWSVRRGDLGEEYVVRLRVEHSSSQL